MRTATENFVVLIVSAHFLLLLAAWIGHRLALESSPVARGAAYAESRGCIECHGDPKYPLADRNDRVCSNINRTFWHAEYSTDCGDVFAYFEAVRLHRNYGERERLNLSNPLIAGEHLARKYHCFQCHGYLGQGGFKNAKSLKGYVPGYFGTDFRILTQNADPDSVRDWISHGLDSSIVEKPITGGIAMFFFRRQAVNMPAFKSLDPDEIETLVNYVIAINQFGPMSARAVRDYGESTRSTSRYVASSERIGR